MANATSRQRRVQLEREYKYLLDAEQYQAVWQKMRTAGELCLQENHIFDHDGRLGRARWMLRLRLERTPISPDAVTEAEIARTVNDLAGSVTQAFMTLKGPRLTAPDGVVRPEVEEECSPHVGVAAAQAGRLTIDVIPPRIAGQLRHILGAKDGQSSFSSIVVFQNLRLRRRLPGRGHIEIALDWTRAGDGRVRRELEIEWRPGSDRTVEKIMNELNTASFQPTTVSKLVWVLSSSARRQT